MNFAAKMPTTILAKCATLSVWLAFILIGAWGHFTHWNFTRLVGAATHGAGASAELPAASTAITTITAPSSRLPLQIELSSVRAIEQMGITLIDVENRPLQRELTVAARVDYEPTRVAQLTSRVPGTVWRVDKQVGEVIHRGDVLAIIDATLVGQAKADLLQAFADVTAKQRIYERIKSIGVGAVSQKQVEQAEVEARKSRFNLFNAQQTLNNLGLPVDSERLNEADEEKLLRYVKFLGLPPSVTESLSVKTATANLLPLFAPFDGVVIGQDIVKGEVLSTDRMAVEIADMSRMLIKMSVREEDAADLKIGQPVVFTANKAEASGAISWISTEVDVKTRTVEVRSSVENPIVVDGRPGCRRELRAHLFGAARIQLEDKPQAYVVPTEAVQWDGVSHVVFVRTGEATFEMRQVDIGIQTDELTELLHGVSIGERVAVEGSHILKSEALKSNGV